MAVGLAFFFCGLDDGLVMGDSAMRVACDRFVAGLGGGVRGGVTCLSSVLVGGWEGDQLDVGGGTSSPPLDWVADSRGGKLLGMGAFATKYGVGELARDDREAVGDGGTAKWNAASSLPDVFPDRARKTLSLSLSSEGVD
jgi:hypothetical protein